MAGYTLRRRVCTVADVEAGYTADSPGSRKKIGLIYHIEQVHIRCDLLLLLHTSLTKPTPITEYIHLGRYSRLAGISEHVLEEYDEQGLKSTGGTALERLF